MSTRPFVRPGSGADRWFAIKTQIHTRLLNSLSPDQLRGLNKEGVRDQVGSQLERLIAEDNVPMTINERERLIEDILDELEDTGLERTRQLVAQAKSLQAVPLQRGDFAKNLLVRATGSVLGYQGASVSALGEVYAKRPGQQGYEVVTPKSFVILSIIYAPPQTADVIAHNGKISWPVAYVVNAEYAMTLIIPAELIPCELEFVDALRTRIPLNSKPK